MSPRNLFGGRGSKGKRRRHGYRGYGSQLREGFGAIVHWGRGFGGGGFAGENGVLALPEAGILSRHLREENTRRDREG